MGNIAYGSRLAEDGLHLEPDPAEQAVLQEIKGLRQDGKTLRGIAAVLNYRGLRTRRGSAWQLEHVGELRSNRSRPANPDTAGIHGVLPEDPSVRGTCKSLQNRPFRTGPVQNRYIFGSFSRKNAVNNVRFPACSTSAQAVLRPPWRRKLLLIWPASAGPVPEQIALEMFVRAYNSRK